MTGPGEGLGPLIVAALIVLAGVYASWRAGR